MIDNGEFLETWQIKEGDMGRLISEEPITAELIDPHRRDYLEYEGPVSQGRGRVEIYDTGEYTLINRKKTSLSLLLRGKRCNGTIIMQKTSGSSWDIFFNNLDE